MITSRNHPQIRKCRKLLTRKGRDESNCFLVEGIRPIASLFECDAHVELLIAAPDLLSSQVGWNLVAQHRTGGGECLTVSADVFGSLSVRDNPQGLAAVAKSDIKALDDLDTARNTVWVVLIDPQDPGNLGTITRSCDAVGAGGIILVGNAVDPYHPKAIRSSLGALFSRPVVKSDLDDVLNWAQRNNMVLLGTSDKSNLDFREWKIDSAVSTVLIMGSERQGIPDDVLRKLTSVVRIPMLGMCDSLNLAVATSIMLYEVTRQRSAT